MDVVDVWMDLECWIAIAFWPTFDSFLSKRSFEAKKSYKHFFFLTDEEWEKDLAAEIQDFEVVDDHNPDESDLDLK